MAKPSDMVVHKPSGELSTDVLEAREALVQLDRRSDEAADASVPANTRRAYEMELRCFASWCTRHGVRASPAEPRVVRAYLRELADQGRALEDMPSRKPRGPLGYSALIRALCAICTSNVSSGHTSIWNDALIIDARRAFGVEKGTAPKKQKRDVGSSESLLFRMCDLMDDSVRGTRDRALILVGWHGGKRRSEIVAARVEHFEPTESGHLRWMIPRSKTDQLGRGLTVLLPLGQDERYCPVRALQRWLTASHVEGGYVFRGVDMVTGAVMEAPLAPEGVARRVQHYAKLLGLDPNDFGGHSLRSGFITTARRAGRRMEDIMDVTGHRDPKTVLGYIRRVDLEEGSAAKGLLDEQLAQHATSTPAPATSSTPTFMDRFTRPFR